MIGFATTILIIALTGAVIHFFGKFGATPGNVFKDLGKLSIGVLAAKEIYDIATKDPSSNGIVNRPDASPINPNDSQYGQRP